MAGYLKCDRLLSDTPILNFHDNGSTDTSFPVPHHNKLHPAAPAASEVVERSIHYPDRVQPESFPKMLEGNQRKRGMSTFLMVKYTWTWTSPPPLIVSGFWQMQLENMQLENDGRKQYMLVKYRWTSPLKNPGTFFSFETSNFSDKLRLVTFFHTALRRIRIKDIARNCHIACERMFQRCSSILTNM